MLLRRSEPESLRFASFLSYCPRGESPAHRESQSVMRLLKENRMMREKSPPISGSMFAARRLAQEAPPEVLSVLRDAVLVPVPRSSLSKSDSLWPALEICNALVAQGIGARVLEALRRERALTKAAWAETRDRPTVEAQCESLAVERPLDLPGAVVLVDDVVTRGATLLGCARHLRRLRPELDVAAFAMIRTISAPEKFERILSPCAGTISLGPNGCTRDP
jgi:hypothetical protein